MSNAAPDLTSDPVSDWRIRLSAALASGRGLGNRELFREINPDLDYPPILSAPPSSWRNAAVLVPIIDHSGGPTVLLTVRSSGMPSHAGQIGFPGGLVHDDDTSRQMTALRETEEEVGIPRSSVDVLGETGVHFGGLGFAVTPVIGVVPGGIRYTPCEREVAELFEVPLAYLTDPANHRIEQREARGIRYNMFAVPYKDYHIWGLTAGIIHSLARLLHNDDFTPGQH